ncbi:MAG TPA: hypothetical protein VD838_20875 [Anaeromyxobacteraceae bacterium]|nr:hypothetical protein [Anaeromyxobacteraceae bacterium]
MPSSLSSGLAFFSRTSCASAVRAPFSSRTPVIPRANAKRYSPSSNFSIGNSLAGSSTPATRSSQAGPSPRRTGAFGRRNVPASRSVSPQSSLSSTP